MFDFSKLAAHADDRLRERTNLPQRLLDNLRVLVGAAKLPAGTHHVRLPGGASAVIKDTGRQHVVATILGRNMHPPGRGLTSIENGINRLERRLRQYKRMRGDR